MSFTVRTEVFEGPFDLLLHLILKEDVDLYEIELAKIVDAYLDELSRMDENDLDISTEFLLIAATLVELKCRRLLPVEDDFDLDEELMLWEERDLLLARLLECKTFKDASSVLRHHMELMEETVARQFGLEDPFLALTPDPLAAMTPQKLRRAFLRMVSEKPEPSLTLDHVSIPKASVNEAIETLIYDLPRSGPRSFRQLTEGMTERIEVVVVFLAVLELYKQGMVDMEQPHCFGELTVSWLAEADRDEQSVVELVVSGADAYDG